MRRQTKAMKDTAPGIIPAAPLESSFTSGLDGLLSESPFRRWDRGDGGCIAPDHG
jgi:hypothetical protein